MSFSEGMFVSFTLGDIYLNIMISKKQQRREDYGQTFETKNLCSVRWFGSGSHFSLQFPCDSLLQIKNSIKDISVFTEKIFFFNCELVSHSESRVQSKVQVNDQEANNLLQRSWSKWI